MSWSSVLHVLEYTPEPKYFDEADVEKMLILLESEHIKYRAMIYVALFSGCRLGELGALEWPDDLEAIKIKQSGQALPVIGAFIKTPKNEHSWRVTSLPPMVTAVLREYKAWQSEERLKLGTLWNENIDESGVGHNYIFTQREGKPIYPTTPSNWFREFLRRTDLPYVNFHGLRHTSASILIAEGVDLMTIANRLGHVDPSTTMKIYAHALKRPDKEAADKFETRLNKSSSTSIRKV